jgi:Fic family protein
MKKADRFNKRIEQLPSSIWSKIAKIDELKGRWVEGVRLSPQFLSRLKQTVLITSTGSSTRIEGAQLSDSDVENLMRGVAMQKFPNRDKQEVRGYYELLKNVFDSWKTLRFREGSIKHFHQELLKYVEKDRLHRGEYKKRENKVVMLDKAGRQVGVVFDTTPAYLTPKETLELVEWTQGALKESKYHPLLVIGNFLVEFLNIHPFQDGNGRLSRILTNFLLLKKEYLYIPYVSHEKLVEDNKPDYYIALRKSQRTSAKAGKVDIIDWLDFFLTILLEQAEMAIDLLKKENIESVLSAKQLAVWGCLQDADEVSAGEITRKTKVARPTVNQALDKLLRFKKIERIGMGRSTRYRKI